MLNDSERLRYSRQLMHPGFGEEGQRKLKEAHVVVAGIGGLGSASATYLAAAGVGHLTLIDHDRVELANLNRQILYWEEDIGAEKVFSSSRKLSRLNPAIEITPVVRRITAENARGLVRGASAVIDGMDNFEGRLALNSACLAEGVPFIHAGIHGLMGQLTTIIPGKTPCLACLFPRYPGKKPIPVFGFTPGIMACLQVAEAVKLLAGLDGLLTGRMLYVNAQNMSFHVVETHRRPDCAVCHGL